MANRFWVGGTGFWSQTAHWSTTSGGGGGSAVPTSIDDVFFDSNSFSGAGQSIELNNSSYPCRNFSISGVTNDPEFHFGADHNELAVYGDLTIDGSMEFPLYSDHHGIITLANTRGGVTKNIDFQGSGMFCGINFGGTVTGSGSPNTWNIISDINTDYYIEVLSGIFNANSANISCTAPPNAYGFFFSTTPPSFPGQLNMGSGTWTFTGASGIGNVAWFSDASLIDAQTSTIVINMNDYDQFINFSLDSEAGYGSNDYIFNKIIVNSTNTSFPGNNGTLVFAVDQGGGPTPAATLTIDTLTINPADGIGISASILFEGVNNITNLEANGNADHILTIDSTSIGEAAIMNVTNSSVSYVQVANSDASGGNPIDNRVGGVDLGGNSNWIFFTSGGALSQINIAGLIENDDYHLSFDLVVVTGHIITVKQGTNQINVESMGSSGTWEFDFTADDSGNSIIFTPSIDSNLTIDNVSLKHVIKPTVHDDRPVKEFLVGNLDGDKEIFFRVDTQLMQIMPTFETFANPVAIVTKLQRGTLVKCFVALDDGDFYQLEGNATKGTSITKIHSKNKSNIPTPPAARKITVSWRDSSKQLCRLTQGAILFLPTTMDYSE